MNPIDGTLKFMGEYDNKVTEFVYDGAYLNNSDRVLIAVDSAKDYIKKDATKLTERW